MIYLIDSFTDRVDILRRVIPGIMNANKNGSMMRREYTKSEIGFSVFLLLFCFLFVFVEFTNNKLWTNDFRVYFGAVQDFFSGKNPYVDNYGLDSGFFKYPPFTLYLFGILKLIPFWLGQFIHLFILASSFFVSIFVLRNMTFQYLEPEVGKKRIWLLYVGFLCIAIHLTREFHMGNINLILLVLFVLGLSKIQTENSWLTVICWSLMAIMKPIMILVFVPLIFYKKWKLILSLSGFGLFFFLFPILTLGWNGNLQIWTYWFQSIAAHGTYIVSENSFKYLSNFYFGIQSEWLPSLIVFMLLVSVMVFHRIKQNEQPQDLIRWMVVFSAFTPNFFVTDTEHFLLSLPLIVFLLMELIRRKSILAWTLFGLAIVPFSFNSNDLLGRKISDYFDQLGVLGISNLLFIVLFLVLILFPKSTSENILRAKS